MRSAPTLHRGALVALLLAVATLCGPGPLWRGHSPPVAAAQAHTVPTALFRDVESGALGLWGRDSDEGGDAEGDPLPPSVRAPAGTTVRMLPRSQGDAAFGGVVADSVAQRLYWTDGAHLRSVGFDGGAQRVVAGPVSIISLHGVNLGAAADDVLAGSAAGEPCRGLVWHSSERVDCYASSARLYEQVLADVAEEAGKGAGQLSVADLTLTTASGGAGGGVVSSDARIAEGHAMPIVASLRVRRWPVRLAAVALDCAVAEPGLGAGAPMVYWSDTAAGVVRASWGSGAGLRDAVTGVGRVLGVVLLRGADTPAEHVTLLLAAADRDALCRAHVPALPTGLPTTIDGCTDVLPGVQQPRGVALQAARSMLLFATLTSGLWTLQPVGAGGPPPAPRLLVPRPSMVRVGGVAADEGGRAVFWVEAGRHNRVLASDWLGSSPTVLAGAAGDLAFPRGVAAASAPHTHPLCAGLPGNGTHCDVLFVTEFPGRIVALPLAWPQPETAVAAASTAPAVARRVAVVERAASPSAAALIAAARGNALQGAPVMFAVVE